MFQKHFIIFSMNNFVADQHRICRVSLTTDSPALLMSFVPVLGSYVFDPTWSRMSVDFDCSIRSAELIQKQVDDVFENVEAQIKIELQDAQRIFNEKSKTLESELRTSIHAMKVHEKSKEAIRKYIRSLNTAAKEIISKVLSEFDKSFP